MRLEFVVGLLQLEVVRVMLPFAAPENQPATELVFAVERLSDRFLLPALLAVALRDGAAANRLPLVRVEVPRELSSVYFFSTRFSLWLPKSFTQKMRILVNEINRHPSANVRM